VQKELALGRKMEEGGVRSGGKDLNTMFPIHISRLEPGYNSYPNHINSVLCWCCPVIDYHHGFVLVLHNEES
jgi:hypothetical protein